MRNITEIIIHCSATPEGRSTTTDDITKWHKARGFRTIGYHYVVYLDGSIHDGRSESEIGAHCEGHNRNSIGICYVGGLDINGKPKDTRTESQKKSLRQIVSDLQKKYPAAKLYMHNEFAKKACPSFKKEDF